MRITAMAELHSAKGSIVQVDNSREGWLTGLLVSVFEEAIVLCTEDDLIRLQIADCKIFN